VIGETEAECAKLDKAKKGCARRMERFVGKKKEKKPTPTLGDASKRLGERGESVEGKISKIDKELALVKRKLKGAKGSARDALRRKAADLLKRRKMYEKQAGNLSNTAYNIDQQQFTLDSMKDAQEISAAMKTASKQMKKEVKKVNLNKLEDLQDDIADYQLDAEEINDTLGRAMGFEDELDEDELDDELAALDELDLEDLGDEDEADYLKSSSLPSAPTAQVQGEEKDQYGLPKVPMADP